MALATHLLSTLRNAGLEVIECDGWRTRQSRSSFSPQGIVAHHTVTTTRTSDENVAHMLCNGRPDLAGPLAQMGLDRRGRIWLCAAGRANHNGYGTWGNDAYGIEAYNSGVGEPWPQVQLDAYAMACAAICKYHGWGADRVKAHRETDPKRKIDPAGIAMPSFRTAVALDISRLTHPNPTPGDQMSKEQFDAIMNHLAQGFMTIVAEVDSLEEEQRELKRFIIGIDNATQHDSIWQNVFYWSNETMRNGNLEKLHALLALPDALVKAGVLPKDEPVVTK